MKFLIQSRFFALVAACAAACCAITAAEPTNENRIAHIEEIAFVSEYAPIPADTDAAWGEAINSCSIALRVASKPFRRGEPINIEVLIRNVGENIITYPFTLPDKLSTISILDDARKPVPQRLPQTFQEKLSTSVQKSGKLSIQPGLQRRHVLPLTDLFDLSKPGLYSISVTRPIYDTNRADSRVMVRSGNALFRILDQPFQVPTSAITDAGSRLPMATQGGKDSSGSQQTSAQILPETSPAVVPLSNVTRSVVVASSSAPTDTSRLSPARKIGAGIMAALVALLLAIIWRAARRKSQTR